MSDKLYWEKGCCKRTLTTKQFLDDDKNCMCAEHDYWTLKGYDTAPRKMKYTWKLEDAVDVANGILLSEPGVIERPQDIQSEEEWD